MSERTYRNGDSTTESTIDTTAKKKRRKIPWLKMIAQNAQGMSCKAVRNSDQLYVTLGDKHELINAR